MKDKINELIKVYDEYIELLGCSIGRLAAFAHTHNFSISSEENVERGKELREKIKSLKSEI